MPFQKGRTKTGGRKSQLKPESVVMVNERFALAASVREKLEELGFDPLVKIYELIHDPKTPIPVVASLTTDLLRFLYAQRKAVEHTGANGSASAVAQVKIEFVHNDQREVSVSTPVPLPPGEI